MIWNSFRLVWSVILCICIESFRSRALTSRALKLGALFDHKEDRLSILLTGCTGTLGSTLFRKLQKHTPNVHGLYRDKSKLRSEFPDLKQDAFCQLDLSSVDENKLFSLPLPFHPLATRNFLINNAAIYLQGSNQRSFNQSMQVNFFAPLALTLRSLQSSDSPLDIINISSGDGERQFLHSKISNGLDGCESLQDLRSFAVSLIEGFDVSMEYAFGDTPAYSLSKAFLNRATVLLHKQSDRGIYRNLNRVIAVCPGNFLSPMTSEEEKSDADQARFMLSVEEAVEHIVPVVLNIDGRYPGGLFYRYGEVIGW